ncbi:SDR family oxidoreductase [Shewanella baltica]|uniref:UDP-glucose 4-epimerase family protein n=1 Tax=Shewanella baltica TaxID=62322 RepID=UPI00217DD4D1|nr:SDR family oxidoreductase [Shewanella baltica]MCS6229737.1 SDR family oxidoreductase [Shewanella baltica]
MNLLLTGANGFIGSHLLEHLISLDDLNVLILKREIIDSNINTINTINVDLLSDFDLYDVLRLQDVVIHVAAMANANALDDSTELFKMNVDSTLRLAEQSALAGVKRFIFISSIKVNGEFTAMHKAFDIDVSKIPENPYGLSKYLAEKGLRKIASEYGLDVVMIRPPLVYGPGVKANFGSLMNLVSKGIPLPFGCINHNKRSLVSITNLIDLIVTCIDHPKAANQVFLVSDNHDISTSEIVREMAKALDKPTWQLPIPIWCYTLVGKLFDKSDVVDRLNCSLQVDISHTKETLGWKPPQTLQQGFKQTAQAFLQAKTK